MMMTNWSLLLTFSSLFWSCHARHLDIESRAMAKLLYQLSDHTNLRLDLESPNDPLFDQLDEIRARIEKECDEKSKEYAEILDPVQDEFDQNQQQLDPLYDQITDLTRQLDSFQQQLEYATRLRQSLIEKKTQTESDLDQLQSQLQSSIDTLKEIDDNFTKSIAAETQAITLTTNFIDLIKTLNGQPNLDPLFNQIVQLLLQSKSDDVQNRLAKMQLDVDKYRNQGQKERQETKSRLLISSRQLAKEIQADISALQTSKSSNDQNYAQIQAQIQTEIESGNGQLKSILDQLGAVSDAIEERLGQIAAAKDEIGEIQDQVSDLEADRDEIQDKIKDIKHAQRIDDRHCKEYEQQLEAVRRYLHSHPPTALQSACKPGEPTCPLCLYDENCLEGLRCSKYAICYNATHDL